MGTEPNPPGPVIYEDPIPQGPNRGPLPRPTPTTTKYPDPIPQGPNRGPLPRPTPSDPRLTAVSPLAGMRQTLGGGAQSALMGQMNSFGRPTHGDINPGGGIDINGNDIPTPGPIDTLPPTGPVVVGGGAPQMPVVLPNDPAAGGGSDGPPPGAPDASRWLHGGGPAPGSLSQVIQDKILQILNQGPVDPNSEDIKNVVNAARVQERRQGDRARAFMAERRAASGLAGGGGFDTGVLGIEQGIGERLGGLSANLVRESQIQRANEIMSALTLGQGRIDAEQQRALQSELANIQATLQREGMSLQNSQFEAQMSMQALLAMLAGLGGGN